MAVLFDDRARERLEAWLDEHDLSVGLGHPAHACSIGAIWLATTGELQSRIPDWMSRATGEFIMKMQDTMPCELRNSPAWKSLLPAAAATSSARDGERLELLREWFWSTVMPSVQHLADGEGNGAAWQMMCEHRQPIYAYRHLDLRDLVQCAELFISLKSAEQVAEAAAITACLGTSWEALDPVGMLRSLVALDVVPEVVGEHGGLVEPLAEAS